MSLLDNLVAHYKLNDNADSTVVEDEKGNNGASVRNTSLMHTAGKIGGGLNFNGTSDYIDTNATFQTTFRNSFSMSLWVKPDDGNPEGHVQSFIGMNFEEVSQFWIYLSPASTGKVQVNYWVGADTLNIREDEASFTDGPQPWTMITITVTKLSDSTIQMCLYVNAVLRKTSPVTNIPMNGFTSGLVNPYLGALAWLEDGEVVEPLDLLSGSLDNVMIFNKALTADEILTLWNGGNGTEDLSGGISMDFFGQDDDEWNS